MENDKTIFNFLNETSAEVFLYGTIGYGADVDTTVLIPQLDELRRQGIKDLRINVNSDGGCVFQGQALFNYLSRNDFTITWRVDGVAASMAAMLLCNPDHRVEMARYAKLMYHRVQGGTGGTADELRDYAEMLDLFERDLIDMLAGRTGLSAEEIAKSYFDGKDHWVSATEAVNLKLADAIIDGLGEITEPSQLTNGREIVNYYNNQITLIKNHNPMNLKRMTQVLNLADDATEDVIYNTMKTVMEERANLTNQIQQKDTEINNLKNEIKDEKIKKLINPAIKAGKFGEDLRDTYERWANTDFDGCAAAIAKMPGTVRVIDKLGEDCGTPENEKNWTWDDYFKNNRLESLKANNETRFKALYRAKYNKEYKE